ncbi:MAG: hydrogenase maturation protease [Acidobacteriia bacterium]|nr:hydrogenase maturation protease [Terriglobia bacterium]
MLLALGNPLMADDGAGQEMLAAIQSAASEWGQRVEFVDGGTQGLALLGIFEGRKAVVFLDAVRLGDKAGAVHLLTGQELLRMGGRSTTAHEGSAPDILRALQLLGDTPAEIALVGIEPDKIQTGIGLSETVRRSIPVAAGFARMAINRTLAGVAQ